MAILTFVQTFWATAISAIGDTARFAVTAGTTAGNPVLSVQNSAQGQSVAMTLGSGLLSAPAASTQAVSGGTTAFELDGEIHRLDLSALTGLAAAPAGAAMQGSSMLWLDRSGFSGNAVAAYRTGNLVFLSAADGGITTFRSAADGSLTRLSSLADTATMALEGITAMTSLSTTGGHYLIAASQTQNALVVLRIGSDGNLTPVSQIGAAEYLPVSLPTQVGAVTLNGQNFVILGAFGTSSLTVLRLGSDGSLTFADQVGDTRDTRFGGLTAMDIVTVNGQVLLAAAGNDGGVTLFRLLPSGQLVVLDTLVDETRSALQNIVDLCFVMVEGRLELFAMAAGDQGVTRILVDPALTGSDSAGITATSATGTAGNDVLTAPAGGALVRGGAGADVLIGGAGRDTLEGGDGADLYIPLPDSAGRDTIQGFDPAADRIDLSGYPQIYGPGALVIVPTATGALIRFGSVEITLIAAGAAPGSLSVAAVTAALVFAADRLNPGSTLPASLGLGTAEDADVFYWTAGRRIFDGGAGTDRISYAAAPSAAVIDLDSAAANAGSAAGHDLRAIEIVEGSAFGDRIAGTAAGDILLGGDGNDSIDGRGGNDWITPGAGQDTVQGGAGTDMVSFVEALDGVTVSLRGGQAQSGTETDLLAGIENVTGSIFADTIEGDSGANLLRGLGHYDWFVATAGADTIDGGSGRDMISYVNAPGGVTVDLGAGRGLAGMAAGQTYLSVERVTGSSYADIFYGSAGEDDFRGMSGNDWFNGSAGRDRYDGGGGSDTVAYAAAPAGVAASLLLGRGTAGQAARDLYTLIENLTGSDFADTLTGDHGANILQGLGGDDLIFGNGGADRIDGGAGADTLQGGAGNDLIDGGAGRDYAVFAGNRADYIVTGTATQATVQGPDGTDLLTGVEGLIFADGILLL